MKMFIKSILFFLTVTITTSESKGNLSQLFNLDLILDGFKSISANTSCGRHLKEYIHGFATGQSWAQMMRDSSAHTLHGIYMRNNKFIGHFDECLSVRHPENLFQGQHCVLNIDLFDEEHGSEILNHLNYFKEKSAYSQYFSTLFAICIPTTCDSKEIETALGEWFNKTEKPGSIHVKLHEYNCYKKEGTHWKQTNWVILYCLAGICILSLFSTTYDIIQRFYFNVDRPHDLLISFSVYTNSIYIFCDTSGKPDFKALNGIRALYALMILIVHACMWFWLGPVENEKNSTKVLDTIEHLNIVHFNDTFLSLSGFLLAHSFFRRLADSGYYDFPVSFINRYIKVTSLLALTRMFNGWLFLHLGSGPMWNYLNKEEYEACQQNWIAALLYSWNYLNPMQLCMRNNWYVNVDMQLLWLSPLVLIPILRYPRWAKYYLTFLVFGASLISFLIIYSNGFKPQLKHWSKRWSSEHVLTHTKAAPWLIGIFFAYILQICDEKKITSKLFKTQKLVGWLIAICCLAITMHGGSLINPDDHAQVALLLPSQAIVGPIGIAWVIFACKERFGGLVNTILSSRILQFLSNITYGIYFVQFPVMSYIIGVKKTNYFISGILDSVIIHTPTVLLLTLLFAYLVIVLIQIPAIVICKSIMHNVKIYPIHQPGGIRVIKEKKED